MQIGNYEIQSELGRGGMGVVYRAFEPALNRVVALKMLNDGISHEPALVARFNREAQAMAALSDPNVVQIYAVGTHQGQPYFVMEFVDGESLASKLKQGRLEIADAQRWLRQAASGLQAAHERGLVHRDIKPGNLMLTNKGTLKVTDFGIALSEGNSGERLTGTGGVVGTPGYLSPEACLGQPLDARTDIFALGVVFFEMLTGRLPFDDKSPFGLMQAVVQAQIPDVNQLNHHVDASTASILRRMLERKPEARYQSCAEIVADLDRAAKGISVSVPPLPPKTPTPQPATAVRQVAPPVTHPVAPPSTPPGFAHPLQSPPQFTPQFTPQPQYSAHNPAPQHAPQVHSPQPVSAGQPGYVAPNYGPAAPAYPNYPQAPAQAQAPAYPQSTMPAAKKSNVLPIVLGLVGLVGVGGYGLSKLLPASSSAARDRQTSASPEAGSLPTPVYADNPDDGSGPAASSTPREIEASEPLKPLSEILPEGDCGRDLGDSELDMAEREDAAQELLGTYTGTISGKDFTLVFQTHDRGELSGYNIAHENRRPLCGTVLATSSETDDDGDEWQVFQVKMREPGDDKNDGIFTMEIRHADEYIGGAGTWDAFTGQENLEVEIKNFNEKTD